MTCYRPLHGFRSKTRGKSGKRGIVFKIQDGLVDLPITVPCGQCIGCKLEYSRQWAIRCTHEAQMHDQNCFITLTYNNHNLPENKSINLRHFQLFMKRLRKRRSREAIRFFHCGEYGEQCNQCKLNRFACTCSSFEPSLGRPHYHACLFNCDFEDKTLWKNQNNIKLYTSEQLSELWPFGFSTIGEVTFESAAYVARYVTKKITGEMAQDHYSYTDPETKITHQRKPEYLTMSRRPGIGKNWLEKYHSDIINTDTTILNGKKTSIPKFYDTVIMDKLDTIINLSENYQTSQQLITKSKRYHRSKKHKSDQTDTRLKTREIVKLAQITNLNRPL